MNYNKLNIRTRQRKALRRQKQIIMGMCAFISVICVIIAIILIRGLIDSPDPSETIVSSDSNITDRTTSEPSTDSQTSVVETEAPISVISEEDREQMRLELEQSLAAYIEQSSGRLSIAYLNLDNGETISVNGETPFVAASSIKIAYNTYLYQQFESGDLSPDDIIAYDASPYPDGDYESGTGTIQHSPDGTTYPLSEVSKLSIRISDNCATNMIIRQLGGIDAINENYMQPISHVVDYRQSVSYTDFAGNAQSGRHRTSAIDLARYMENLYRLYEANPSLYQPLIDDLSNTDFSWGIPQGIASDTQVAHKIGFNSAYGTDNDVAIVFGMENYVLCVMTETGNAAQGQRDIAALAQMVDDYINACYSTN